MTQPPTAAHRAGLPYLLIVLILLGAAVLRLHLLASWPPGLSFDEARNATDALRFAQTGVLPVYLHVARPEVLFRFLQGAAVWLFGPTPFAVRVVSAFVGVIGVAAAYRAGRHFAQPGTPVRMWVGLLAAGTLAVMIGHVQLSRTAYRMIALAPVMLLFFDAFVSAWRTHRPRDFALGGLWLALCAQTYTAGLIMVPVAAIGVLQQAAMHRSELRRWARGAAIFAGVALVAVVPLFVLFFTQAGMYDRLGDVSSAGTPLGAALWRTWQTVYLRGDINPQYNIAQAPLLWPPLFALLIVGLVASALSPKRLTSWLVVGMVLLGLFPVALAEEIPHGARIAAMYGALPLGVAASWPAFAWMGERITWPGWKPAAGALFAVLLSAAALTTVTTFRTATTADLRWGEGGVISAYTWFYETRYQAAAELTAEAEGVVYLPQAAAAHPAMRFFLARSHPTVTTFARYFGSTEAIDLPPGDFIIPAGQAGATDFVAALPDGTLVLLPRFDERLAAAAARGGEPFTDAYGERAGVRIPDPTNGEGFTLTGFLANEAAINYAGRMTLVGWDGPFTLPEEGGQISVTLYLTPGEGPRPNVLHFEQLWDSDVNVVAARGGTPLLAALYPPHLWQPGDVVPLTRTLEVPPNLDAGVYYLAAGFLDRYAERLPVLAPDGTIADDIAVVGAMRRPLPPTGTADLIPVEAALGEAIGLLGYRLTGPDGTPLAQLQPGQQATIRLVWAASARPAESYNIFVHVQNPAGEIVAQSDKQPRDGTYPTVVWGAGDTIETVHPLAVPADASGPLSIYAGMYQWPSLERLRVVQGGAPNADGRILLTGGQQ